MVSKIYLHLSWKILVGWRVHSHAGRWQGHGSVSWCTELGKVLRVTSSLYPLLVPVIIIKSILYLWTCNSQTYIYLLMHFFIYNEIPKTWNFEIPEVICISRKSLKVGMFSMVITILWHSLHQKRYKKKVFKSDYVVSWRSKKMLRQKTKP